MKKEDELIFFMSKLSGWEECIDQMAKLLNDKLDWGYIILNCRCNKVSNIFYHNLCLAEFGKKLKKQVLKIYMENYKYTEFRLAILREYFYGICEKLNEMNIKYAIIKGFALNDLVYYKYGSYLRDFNDIDILVKENDLEVVSSLLNQLGYIQGEYDIISESVSPASREEIVRMKMTSHQVVPFCKVAGKGSTARIPIEVDINFTIFEGGKISPLISTEEILENTITIKAEKGCKYKTLTSYFMFIQIVYHFYKEFHYEFMQKEYNDLTILKLCDLREFIIMYFSLFKQDELVALINKYKLNDSMYYVLFLLKSFYNDLDLDDFLDAIKLQESIIVNEVRQYGEKITETVFHSDFNL